VDNAHLPTADIRFFCFSHRMTAIFAIFWLDLLLIIRRAPFLFSGETGHEAVSAGPRADEHSTAVGVKVDRTHCGLRIRPQAH
jgi:hypothetical protein